jgi:hypothetical protein
MNSIMSKTYLWVEPASGRIAHFAEPSQPAPRSITIITSAGRIHHELTQLERHSFDGPLPDEMLPQVCWMFKYRGGCIEFAPQMD